jgi:hypothetical protein
MMLLSMPKQKKEQDKYHHRFQCSVDHTEVFPNHLPRFLRRPVPAPSPQQPEFFCFES